MGKYKSHTVMAIEVKAPFTDTGGIRHKTNNKRGLLAKDLDALTAAMVNGVPLTYELFAMFECYVVNKRGKLIKATKKELWENYGVKYPTEWGYHPTEGEQEVNDAIKSLAKSHGLKVKRKGWRRVELPQPHPKVSAFVDCALYKVQPK